MIGYCRFYLLFPLLYSIITKRPSAAQRGPLEFQIIEPFPLGQNKRLVYLGASVYYCTDANVVHTDVQYKSKHTLQRPIPIRKFVEGNLN